ncbi:MAG: response regulator [Desulfobacteraceae bacterium]|nr:response regulator [Desulfobacteraceae bacterium]
MDIVLVIDDEKPILNMFQLLLGFYGYTVLTAENGEQGISIFKEESPPIVFLDIKMPGMDGREVLKQIREIDSDAEVIIMTGHGDKELEREVMNLQANDYINKPFQKDSLEEALKRLAQRRGKQ